MAVLVGVCQEAPAEIHLHKPNEKILDVRHNAETWPKSVIVVLDRARRCSQFLGHVATDSRARKNPIYGPMMPLPLGRVCARYELWRAEAKPQAWLVDDVITRCGN